MSPPLPAAFPRVPPESPFTTTNRLSWSLKWSGYQTLELSSGVVYLPVYTQLGKGQFGRVFEVVPASPPPPAAAPAAAAAAGGAAATATATADNAAANSATQQTTDAPAAANAAAAAANGGDHLRSGSPPNPAAAAAATSAAAGVGAAAAATAAPPPRLPASQRYAAKLLLLPNYKREGVTADLLREFSMYGDLETPGSEGLGFANVLKVFGITSCIQFSKPFADAYLSGVQTAGVLVVERCASDFAAFVRLLNLQKKLNHSALKFYAWQLLNGTPRV